MANGTAQVNGSVRNQQQSEPPAILHLLPINGTFDRKTITVPYYPDVLRIGRQTNQKTVPTALNGYFDSKVLSRQHAEVYADRQGRIFIKDVKSSNGTFVNGMRLSQENKESEPRELREQDVLELGIDIVSEDQKTVVHHKVAAKVEHAGVYGQGNDSLTFGELDPSAGGGMMVNGQNLKRNGSQGSINGRASVNMAGQQALQGQVMGQPAHVRNWLNPITTEHIVRKLNVSEGDSCQRLATLLIIFQAEMKLAMQQSQDLARARKCIEAMLGGEGKPSEKEPKKNSEKIRPSPVKQSSGLKAQFSDPPAPPPQAPLPEKPDVAKALADPLIQPLLRRAESTRPSSANSSPTRMDHSGDILRLCEELKLAKGELSSQAERMKGLETQLEQERMARESAESRALRLESSDSTETSTEAEVDEEKHDSPKSTIEDKTSSPPDLQTQLERLQATMDEMKQQMESYRMRAENAETERDEAQTTLAEMVEQKRAENAALAARSASRSRRSSSSKPKSPTRSGSKQNGHAVSPSLSSPRSPTGVTLLEKAGLEEGQIITADQARILQQFLDQEVLGLSNTITGGKSGTATVGAHDNALTYHGRPLTGAALVVVLGVCLMGWMNNWPRVDR
jgi:hypothetical protein